jgi:hypothetical protein
MFSFLAFSELPSTFALSHFSFFLLLTFLDTRESFGQNMTLRLAGSVSASDRTAVHRQRRSLL